jgi:hypothetical protein
MQLYFVFEPFSQRNGAVDLPVRVHTVVMKPANLTYIEFVHPSEVNEYDLE